MSLVEKLARDRHRHEGQGDRDHAEKIGILPPEIETPHRPGKKAREHGCAGDPRLDDQPKQAVVERHPGHGNEVAKPLPENRGIREQRDCPLVLGLSFPDRRGIQIKPLERQETERRAARLQIGRPPRIDRQRDRRDRGDGQHGDG